MFSSAVGLSLDSPVHVVGLTGRVGAYNGKVLSRAEFLVCDTGRNENGIANAKIERNATLTTELNSPNSGVTAEDFVRRAVIMMVREHSVPPGIPPAIGTKQ